MMMKTLMLCLCYCFLNERGIYCSTQPVDSVTIVYSKFRLQESPDDREMLRVASQKSLASYSHISLLECARACENISCQTFYYNSNRMQCVFTDASQSPQDLQLKYDEPWSMYALESNVTIESRPRCNHTYLDHVAKCVSLHTDVKKTYNGSIEFCKRQGGQPISFSSGGQFQAFRDYIRENSAFNSTSWRLGLICITSNSTCHWTNSDADVSRNRSLWQRCEPNFDEEIYTCGYIRGRFDYLVDDSGCDFYFPVVCQYNNE